MQILTRTIFEYDNYRAFLRDYYVAAKAQNSKFSYRYFSRVSQIGSPSFLKHVIDGERNLTAPVIEKFIKALKLNKQEALYFKALVQLNQAKTSEERELYAQELRNHKRFVKFQSLSALQMNYYEHWYYVAVRELVGLPSFQERPEWIAKQIRPAITPGEAQNALDELQRLGLIRRDVNGRLCQSEVHVTTGNEVTSAFVARFHREMLQKASESIDRYPKPLRDISSGTFGVSRETFQLIKEKVQEFRKEIQELAARDADQEFVCQLNLQLFPLTKPEEGEES